MAGLQTVQIIGLVGVLSYAIARIAARSGWFSYHRFALLAIPRSGMPKMPRGYVVRPLSQADLAGMIIDVDAGVQALRFEQDLICLGCFAPSGDLAGVIWLGVDRHRDDDVAICFVIASDSCWDTGLWIAPDHRMSRAFSAIWAGVADWMTVRGLTWSVSRIADYNIGSLLPHRRMAARELGSITVFRFGRWQFCWQGQPKWVRGDRDAAHLTIAAVRP